MHLAEERPILRLHMGEEGRSTHGAGGGDGEADQGRADRADAAAFALDRKPRAPPHARLFLVDAHRADDLVRRDAHHRQGDDRDRVVVGAVAVVARKQPLLVAEHRPAQRVGASRSQREAANLTRNSQGLNGVERLEDHDSSALS